MAQKRRIEISGQPYDMTSLIIFSLTFVALSGAPGCVSTPLAPLCPKLDWYESGRRDGMEGKSMKHGIDFMNEQHALCASRSDPPDQAAFANGRSAGLTEFCGPEVGLEAGRAGQGYEDVCPEHLEKPFLQGYSAGQKIRALDSDASNVTAQIDALFRSMSSSEAHQANDPKLRLEIEELRRRHSQIDKQISMTENTIAGAKRL